MNKPSPEVQNKQTPPTSLPKELWLGTCARYTILALIILFFGVITSDSLTVNYVDTVSFFLLLPFGFCLALATRVRRSDKVTTTAKFLLHPLLVLGGGYLCFYLPFQIRTKPSGSQTLMIVLLGAILYAIVMVVVLLVSRRARQKKLDDTPYVNQFGKK